MGHRSLELSDWDAAFRFAVVAGVEQSCPNMGINVQILAHQQTTAIPNVLIMNTLPQSALGS